MKKFVAIILSIVLIGSVLGFLLVKKYSAESSPESTKEFTLRGPSGNLLAATSDTIFLGGTNYRYQTNGDFELHILPNVSDKRNDFHMTIDGAQKQFFSEINLAKAFDVKIEARSFTIEIPENVSVQSIFEKIYFNSVITIPEDRQQTKETIFSIIVKEKRGTAVYTINFGLTDEVYITLNPGGIIL